MGNLPFESVEQLLLGQTALVEEALHERVIALGDFFDQGLPPRSRLILHLLRDVGDFELA